MQRLTIGYYINDKFVLDNGALGGINIMFFGGVYDIDYWFDERRFQTARQAHANINEMKRQFTMVPVYVKDCPNRLKDAS